MSVSSSKSHPRKPFRLPKFIQRLLRMSTPQQPDAPKLRSLMFVQPPDEWRLCAGPDLSFLYNCPSPKLINGLRLTDWKLYKNNNIPQHEFVLFGISSPDMPVGVTVVQRDVKRRESRLRDQRHGASASTLSLPAAVASQIADSVSRHSVQSSTGSQMASSSSIIGIPARDSITFYDITFDQYKPDKELKLVKSGKITELVPITSLFGAVESFHENSQYYSLLAAQCYLFAIVILLIVTKVPPNPSPEQVVDAETISLEDSRRPFGTIVGIPITTSQKIKDSLKEVVPKAALRAEEWKKRLESTRGPLELAEEAERLKKREEGVDRREEEFEAHRRAEEERAKRREEEFEAQRRAEEERAKRREEEFEAQRRAEEERVKKQKEEDEAQQKAREEEWERTKAEVLKRLVQEEMRKMAQGSSSGATAA